MSGAFGRVSALDTDAYPSEVSVASVSTGRTWKCGTNPTGPVIGSRSRIGVITNAGGKGSSSRCFFFVGFSSFGFSSFSSFGFSPFATAFSSGLAFASVADACAPRTASACARE